MHRAPYGMHHHLVHATHYAGEAYTNLTCRKFLLGTNPNAPGMRIARRNTQGKPLGGNP